MMKAVFKALGTLLVCVFGAIFGLFGALLKGR